MAPIDETEDCEVVDTLVDKVVYGFDHIYPYAADRPVRRGVTEEDTGWRSSSRYGSRRVDDVPPYSVDEKLAFKALAAATDVACFSKPILIVQPSPLNNMTWKVLADGIPVATARTKSLAYCRAAVKLIQAHGGIGAAEAMPERELSQHV
jgi:hypothetical protein